MIGWIAAAVIYMLGMPWPILVVLGKQLPVWGFKDESLFVRSVIPILLVVFWPVTLPVFIYLASYEKR